jgi:hypothetical protein
MAGSQYGVEQGQVTDTSTMWYVPNVGQFGYGSVYFGSSSSTDEKENNRM